MFGCGYGVGSMKTVVVTHMISMFSFFISTVYDQDNMKSYTVKHLFVLIGCIYSNT